MSKIIKQASVTKRTRRLKNRPIDLPEEEEAFIEEPSELIEGENERSPAEEAFLLLENARQEASDTVKQAGENAERIMAEARARGYEEGLEQGKSEILTKGRAEIGFAVEALTSALDELDRYKSSLNAQMRDDILDFIIDATEKLLMEELQTNRDAVASVVNDALGKAREMDDITVRINPEDLDTVNMYWSKFEDIFGGARQLKLVKDDEIEAGGCVIEGKAGKIDATVGERFKRFRQSLGKQDE